MVLKKTETALHAQAKPVCVTRGEVMEELLSQRDAASPMLDESDCNFICGEI